MPEGFFKTLVWIFAGIFIYSIFSSSSKDEYYDVSVQSFVTADKGLDLQAVGGLVKRAKSAKQFEQLLNDPNEGVNNLDLDENGEADYIKVTEYGGNGSAVSGFSLTTELNHGDVQEIATIEIEKQNSQEAEVQVKGNEHIYGQNHYHRSHFSLTDALILSYLWRPHPFYMSPWGYGYYPGYYRPYRTVGAGAYRSSRALARNKSAGNMQAARSSSIKSKASSPNAKRNAKSVKAPLRNPTTSQKSFQTRNPSKQVRSGGFGRQSSPSIRKSASSRSGGFRSGK